MAARSIASTFEVPIGHKLIDLPEICDHINS